MEVCEDLVCRLCDKTSEQMFGIFDSIEGGKQISDLIKEALPIKVS